MSEVTPQPEVDDSGLIPKISQETGIPRRTLYNWIAAGKLKTRTVDGLQMVSRAAVLALAASRDAGCDPGNAGTRAGTGASTGTPMALTSPPGPAMLDGEQAAPLFAAFDKGESPADLVQRLRIAPSLAAAAWREYQALRGAASGAKNPLADRMASLEAFVEDLRQQVEGLTTGTWIPAPMRELQAAVKAIGGAVNDLPVPVRGEFTCKSCGNTGFVETYIRCTVCNTQTTWGFRPTK